MLSNLWYNYVFLVEMSFPKERLSRAHKIQMHTKLNSLKSVCILLLENMQLQGARWIGYEKGRRMATHPFLYMQQSGDDPFLHVANLAIVERRHHGGQ